MMYNNKVSIVVPGTYHAFDVANDLYKINCLEKIYTASDFLRVIKWKKSTPLKNVVFSKWPLIKFGKMLRTGDEDLLSKLAKMDKSNIIIGFPGFSSKLFQLVPTKKKILDIDHFNWDSEVCEAMKNEKFKYFDTNKPLDPKKNIMQHNELKKEYEKHNIKYKTPPSIMLQKALECESADIVMVPVSYVKDALIEAGLPKEKILLNPYGYDKNIFFPLKNKKYPKTIMYGGSISYRKGWPYLKRMLTKFKNTNLEFIVAGGVEVNIKSEVEEFFSSCSSNIRYLGPLSQNKLAEYMQNVGLFIFPSVLEGFGMTILQAMASGTAVITSNATCGVDLIINGKNGYVIEKENTDKWVEIINELYKNTIKLECMGKEAFVSVKELTWHNYAKNIISVVV